MPSPLKPIHAILSCIVLLIINYVLFLDNRKFIALEKKFKSRDWALNDVLFWSYIIGAFPLFFLMLILLDN
jgi:hypothetical protein